MYRIAIVCDKSKSAEALAGWTRLFCIEKGMYPMVVLYEDAEHFFRNLKESRPELVILAWPGVAGLNMAEHFRSLLPNCGFIWCSDLDFSLHAYKLRAEYFIKAPPTEAELREGLVRWLERRKQRGAGA